MDDKTKMRIVEESVPLLKLALYKQSVAYLVSTTGTDIALSSGTLVSVGNRLFVATAAHTIPNQPAAEIWVLSSEPRSSAEPYLPIMNRGKAPGDDPDVGFLELDPLAALGYLKKEACPLDWVAVQGVGRPNRSALLIGNPGQYVKPREHVKPGTPGTKYPAIVPLMIAYYTVPLMESEWPAAPNPDPSKDIFLDWPATEAQQLESKQSIFLPNPEGMSGGGIWDQGFETDVLWTVQSARLFGIQSRWHATLRYTRAVQIVHWLRLIHDNYPDLRPLLDQRFPGLA
jgi:hypothetical protein